MINDWGQNAKCASLAHSSPFLPFLAQSCAPLNPKAAPTVEGRVGPALRLCPLLLILLPLLLPVPNSPTTTPLPFHHPWPPFLFGVRSCQKVFKVAFARRFDVAPEWLCMCESVCICILATQVYVCVCVSVVDTFFPKCPHGLALELLLVRDQKRFRCANRKNV